MKLTIPNFNNFTNIRADYHRNGVSGRGFYAIEATDTTRKVITWFPPEEDDDGNEIRPGWSETAVYDIELLQSVGIDFGINSWRGDHYESVARHAVVWFRHLQDINLYSKCYACEDGTCKTGIITAQPQQYVVVDTTFGIVLSDPATFDQTRDEMMAIGDTYPPDDLGSINLGIDEYRGMGQGQETGTSSYDHSESWQYDQETQT